MMQFFKRLKDAHPGRVGLALGSGSARGWAHIGVLNALAEAGVRIDCVAGTSIGALVGAVYASGKLSSLERVVRELDWKKAMALFDVGLAVSGLFDGKKVTNSIREIVESCDIEDLSVPFRAVSTDLVSSREVHIHTGDIIEAIRESISIPGVFTPVKREGMLLVDGGLVNPVPVSVVREMGADYVIAVDLNYGVPGVGGVESTGLPAPRDSDDPKRDRTPSRGRLTAPMAAMKEKMGPLNLPGLAQAKKWLSREPVPNILEVLMSSLNVMETQITEMQLAKGPPDLLIRPRMGHFKHMDFHRGAEAISEGHRAAAAALAGTDAQTLT